MKIKITMILLLMILVGCSRKSEEKPKYTVMYSSDQASIDYHMDTSYLLSYDKNGDVSEETSFQAALYDSISKQGNKYTTINDLFVTTIENGKVSYEKIEKHLGYPSANLDGTFKYKNQRYYVLNGGFEEKGYFTRLYNATKKVYLEIEGGLPYGFILKGNDLYLTMQNNEKPLKVIKVNLDTFKIEKTIYPKIRKDINLEFIPLTDPTAFDNKLFFIATDYDEDVLLETQLTSISLDTGMMRKELSLDPYFKDKEDLEKISNFFGYQNKIYFLSGNRIMNEIAYQDKTFVLRHLDVKLPNVRSMNSYVVMDVQDNILTTLCDGSVSEVDLDKLEVVSKTTLQVPKHAQRLMISSLIKE